MSVHWLPDSIDLTVPERGERGRGDGGIGRREGGGEGGGMAKSVPLKQTFISILLGHLYPTIMVMSNAIHCQLNCITALHSLRTALISIHTVVAIYTEPLYTVQWNRKALDCSVTTLQCKRTQKYCHNFYVPIAMHCISLWMSFNY